MTQALDVQNTANSFHQEENGMMYQVWLQSYLFEKKLYNIEFPSGHKKSKTESSFFVQALKCFSGWYYTQNFQLLLSVFYFSV